MKLIKNKGLAIATLVYWFLLLYIVAALVWWFIALQQQNHQMANFKLLELKQDDPSYLEKEASIRTDEMSKSRRNVYEGFTFLLCILVGAGFVYGAVRRQLKLSLQQQNFMMAITHELKTPIAVTKLNLETLLKHKLDEKKQQKMLLMTLQETERLNTLTNNILISAQLDARRYKLIREELDFSLLALGCVNDFRHRYPENIWEINIEDDLAITGDALLLQIMVNNLLDNAIKYSSKTSGIIFNLSAIAGGIELHIKDEGPGIPDQEKKKIFGRFYRLGNETVRKTKGTGLGLYLCSKIARDHGAEIFVLDNKPQGSDFCIRFMG